MEVNQKNIARFLHRLHNSLRQNDYAGFDPFDGLNSRLFQYSGMNRSSFLRLAWLQFHKRSPINFRRISLVPKLRNPKGISLVILGLLEQYHASGEPSLLNEATNLGDWLLANSCDQDIWEKPCWGYPFAWQARAFYVREGSPNIIATTYVCRALYALTEATGKDHFATVAGEAALFVSESLFHEKDGKGYFAYVPGHPILVHNASLWGAALVARAGIKLGSDDLLGKAKMACALTAAKQRKDGAWEYGERHHHCFVDGFHTGYILEALTDYGLVTGDQSFKSNVSRGLAYYRDNFFLENGAPKYYDKGLFPIETHSAAQALITLLKVSNSVKDAHLADQVLDWVVRNMLDSKKGRFYFRKGRIMKNKIDYVRWVQCWMFYAMSYYLVHRRRSDINE